jgi:hypothetical protein
MKSLNKTISLVLSLFQTKFLVLFITSFINIRMNSIISRKNTNQKVIIKIKFNINFFSQDF